MGYMIVNTCFGKGFYYPVMSLYLFVFFKWSRTKLNYLLITWIYSKVLIIFGLLDLLLITGLGDG